MKNGQVAWNVAIVVQFDDKDEVVKDAYEELEESILIQKRNDNINYYIFFYNPSGPSYIKKLKYGVYNVPKFFIEKNLGVIDFYDCKHLMKFFNEYLKYSPQEEEYSVRNFVITWGHAMGYGFFAQHVEVPSKEADFTRINSESDEIKQIQFLQSQFSIDFDPILTYKRNIAEPTEQKRPVGEIKVISIVKFKEIIEKSIKKVDVLLCMNCYMQTFESGYILRKVVDMLVAPQVLISFYGYNYRKLFSLLHEEPETSLKEIALNLTSFYSLKFAEEPLKSKIRRLESKRTIIPIRNVSFSAVLLKDYDELFLLLNEISKYLLDNLSPELLEMCKKARSKCLSPVGNLVVDFRHFFVEFCRYYDGKLMDTYKTDLMPFQSRLHNFRQKNMLSILQPGVLLEAELGEDLLPSLGPQFFSIFFPVSQPKIQFETKKLLFGYKIVIDDSKWIDFLGTMNEDLKK